MLLYLHGGFALSRYDLFDCRPFLEVFEDLEVPFGDHPDEPRLRLAYPWASQLAYEHIACVGERDLWPLTVVKCTQKTAPNLKLEVVQGDHQSSVGRCLESFLKAVLPKAAPPRSAEARPSPR